MNINARYGVLRSVSVAGLTLYSLHAGALELRDPATRDDDISATQVSATVSRLSSGLYEYRYNVVSPAENRGRIGALWIDISCALDFGNIVYPEPPYPHDLGDKSQDGAHLPVQLYPSIAENGTILSARPGVSWNNHAVWLLALRPENAITGLKMYSPAPPEMKPYKLTVLMDTTDVSKEGYGWDYSNVNDDTYIPWIEDFGVSGMVTGPACKHPEENPDPDPGRFDGSNFPESPVNYLLTYTEPTRDKFHVPADQASFDLIIHYHDEIDPKTFRVEPAWAQRLFNPEPGASERVSLPLNKDKNRFQLQASTGKDGDKRKDDDADHSYKDLDVFEVRKAATNTNKGKSK